MINQSDEQTTALLRAMKEKGGISANMNQSTAKELLRTPNAAGRGIVSFPENLDGGPSGSIRPGGKGSISGSSSNGAAAAGKESSSPFSLETLSTQELVAQLEHDHDAFTQALSDNTRLAKEQMQRSLLQLFEDTAREKLLDPNVVPRRGGQVPPILATSAQNSSAVASPMGFSRSSAASPSMPNNRALASPLAGSIRPSKRPTDRGLDRRDNPSDIIIPDHVREALSSDIYTVVDHELKRFTTVVVGDLGRILEQVKAVRDRMSKLEEELMQRSVENKMQADQLISSGNLISSLQEQVAKLQEHNLSKDTQMDLLRSQIARRNTALDETRVKFRKEVMRYKSRVYELEMELDTSAGKKNALKRISALTDVMADDDGSTGPELQLIKENAVKEEKERHEEEVRQLTVKHAREVKALVSEMHMKISERDNEILRLRAKAQRPVEALEESKR
jgi:hypothetical protein